MVSTGRGAQDKYTGWKELQFLAKHEAFHTKATSFRSEATPLQACFSAFPVLWVCRATFQKGSAPVQDLQPLRAWTREGRGRPPALKKPLSPLLHLR